MPSFITMFIAGWASLVSAACGAPDEETLVLLEGLLAHDRSVLSMEWSQDLLSPDGDGGWELTSRGRRGFDRHGRWYSEGRIGFRRSPDGPIEFYEGLYAYDGEVMRTLNVEARAGYIRPLETETRSSLSPRLLLGRVIGYESHQRLAELMMEGHDLRVAHRDADRSEVTLEAEVRIGSRYFVLLVTLDTERDYLPTRILRYDSVNWMLKEEIVTTKTVRYDGVWVPVEGYRTVFLVDDSVLTQQHSDALVDRMRALGLPDEPDHTDPAQRRAMRAAVLDIFPDGMPRVPLGDGTSRLVVTEITSFNEQIAPDRFVLRHPPGTTVVNVFTGERFVVEGRQ